VFNEACGIMRFGWGGKGRRGDGGMLKENKKKQRREGTRKNLMGNRYAEGKGRRRPG